MGQYVFRGDEEQSNPLWAGFAAGVTVGQAAAAVAAAEAQLSRAEAVRAIVRMQAVRALSEQDMSARQIADGLGLSKSVVGRELRSGIGGWAVLEKEPVKAAVSEAWGRSVQ